MRTLSAFAIVAVALLSLVRESSQIPLSKYGKSDDLHTFVTRPDLRPPKFNIKVHNESRVDPGYILVAPYSDLLDRAPSSTFEPGQIGPHIYDGAGGLVWSGAHLFNNRATFDFKKATCNGTSCFTFILKGNHQGFTRRKGAGVILDNSLRIQSIIPETVGRGVTNMHEFTITQSNTALRIASKPEHISPTEMDEKVSNDDNQSRTHDSLWVANNGFHEVDIATSRTIFEWWVADHFQPLESFSDRPLAPTTLERPWDAYHINSVEKDDEGNYLVSSRYLHSIFKVSGKDGSVLWRLGGLHSSFTLEGFTFSSQHHARFRQQNETHTVLSLFNNGADDFGSTSNVSSAMIVMMDHTTMVARLEHKWDRPDKRLSKLRGNAQLLPNGNNFVCWSENGRISEFSPEGDLLLDGQFASHRFVTYRGFKFDLNLAPSERPVLKALVYGSDYPKKTRTTAIYVSWNGATEVKRWRFYGSNLGSSNSPDLLGEVEKTGFETNLMVSGLWCSIYAEAIAADGSSIGRTPVNQAEIQNAGEAHACTKSNKVPASQLNAASSSEPESKSSVLPADSEKLNALKTSARPVSRILNGAWKTGTLFIVVILLGFGIWKSPQLFLKKRMIVRMTYEPLKQDSHS